MVRMDQTLYRPPLRQIVALAAIAAIALTYGFGMRYAVIQNSVIGIGCETASTLLCTGRHATIVLFQQQLFGAVALATALLNLCRPRIVLVAIALIAGGAGIVLYNTVLSALAVAALILSLARPAPARG
jgi:hypothetical protein